jgi:hypothetical protein
MSEAAREYQVNEYTPDPSVTFDRKIAAAYIKYGRMLVDRGYVQSSLGGMAIREPHPDHPDGIVYA